MAIGTITMILGNVALQVFNSWSNNRQNDELQQKRGEYERAVREHQTNRMWRLLREGQALTLEIEKNKHDFRVKELEQEIDQALWDLTHQPTIYNWPLNVLPIVMKNQAFGNLLTHQEDSFALHCIFTPSNCLAFNKYAFLRIEQSLEDYCNKFWSPVSTHPILFYSGAWKSNDAPSGTQINSMRAILRSIPTLMITPYFTPDEGKLLFHVHMWGVGASSKDLFDFLELEPQSDALHFQQVYTNKIDYGKETQLVDELVEDFVPYLQCLIGYMADTYFWSSAGLSPHLPSLLTDGTINTDGMKYLIKDSSDYYDKLLLSGEEKAINNPFANDALLNLFEGSSVLWDEGVKRSSLESIISVYNGRILGNDNVLSLYGALCNRIYHPRDLPFLSHLDKYSELLSNTTKSLLEEEIIRLNNLEPQCFSRDSFSFNLMTEVYEQELDMERVLRSFQEYCVQHNIDDLCLLISCHNQNEYHFNTYDEEKDVVIYYDEPFNYCYHVESVRNQRIVDSLFPYGRKRIVSCRLDRINYLIERINSKDLVY